MRTQDEITKDIKTILEEKVAPSVAAHNGAIGFIDFAMDTGVATLKLSGSCSVDVQCLRLPYIEVLKIC